MHNCPILDLWKSTAPRLTTYTHGGVVVVTRQADPFIFTGEKNALTVVESTWLPGDRYSEFFPSQMAVIF